MERVVLLKTQLAEAAKLAASNNFANQRLAVILLDNFAEIQLLELMKSKFDYDEFIQGNPKRYNQTIKKKIFFHHGELLKACFQEKIITLEEIDLFAFCHDVRNNLYHKAKEEHSLTSVALKLLHDLIWKYQPEWRSGRSYMTGRMEDPYAEGKDHSSKLSVNSKQDWDFFLSRHFNFIEKGSLSVSELISEHLLEKIQKSIELYEFLLEEYSTYSPGSEDWQLNDFLRLYSFFKINDYKLKGLKETVTIKEYNVRIKEMSLIHRKEWVFVRPDRLTTLEQNIRKLASLPAHKALDKYNKSFKTEVYLIYESLADAAGDLEAEIDAAIDQMRER